MPDLFENMGGEDAFALPGDEDKLSSLPSVEAEPEAAAPSERPRDEQGRFAKADEPVSETPSAVSEPPSEDVLADGWPGLADSEIDGPPPAADAAERLLAGNFKNVDDLERAYEDLRSRFGQQGNELGQLRQTFEERFAQIDQRLQTPQAPPVQITAQLIEDDPATATQLAFEQGNATALRAAYDQWEVTEPAKAGAWLATQHASEQLKTMQQAYDQRIAQLEQKIAPVEQATAQQQKNQAIVGLRDKLPGFDSFAGEHLSGLLQEFPEEADALTNGTPEQTVRSLSKLFAIHRGRLGDNLVVAQQEADRAAVEQEKTARDEAFVASATTNSGAATSLSAAEKIAKDWGAERAAVEAGWNV